MTQMQSKIHALGPRKMSSTGKGFYNSAGQNGFGNKPLLPVTTLPQPKIKYILIQHPQFDLLVKELTGLRSKYDQLLLKFAQKSNQESLRSNIQQVIESTQNIEAKMSRIVQDSNRMQRNDQQKQNITIQNTKAPSIQKQRHQKECLEIIETVNRATQKIEQLQGKNKKLKNQIQTQRQWKQGLQKENKRLRLMLQNTERQKEQQIQNLKVQLSELTYKKVIKKQRQSFNQVNEIQFNKKIMEQLAKSHNEHNTQNDAFSKQRQRMSNQNYLGESQNMEREEEVSGFSRLSINGQNSRVSKIYE